MIFHKNQRGFSLIEALIAISIASAAGVAYMTHVQTVAKNEARQKIRSSLTLLESQAVDFLKSKDVCSANLSVAFDGVVINGATVAGDPDYLAIKNKGYLDASGNLVQRDIFKVGDLFDANRIFVSNVSYELSELTTVAVPNSPWTKSGKVIMSVTFDTCRNNSRVMDKDSSGALIEVCPVTDRLQVIKKFEKLAAFKLKPDGTISSSDIRKQVLNPSTGLMQWETTGTKKDLACADSQDALVEAANSYTDSKVCFLELKSLILSRRSGTTDCGLAITISPKFENMFTSNSSITLPEFIFSEDDNITLIGGGGHGNFGGSSGRGKGGRAAAPLKRFSFESLAKLIPSSTCTIRPGLGGGVAGNGGNGQDSYIMCGSMQVRNTGGLGNIGRYGDSNPGENGENSHDIGPLGLVLLGQGGGGRCRTSCSGSDGVFGSGGGGGAGCNNCSGWRKQGTNGGNGFVKIKYTAFTVQDPNNVFSTMGTTARDLLISAPGVVVSGP